jgi:hypothetical protein
MFAQAKPVKPVKHGHDFWNGGSSSGNLYQYINIYIYINIISIICNGFPGKFKGFLKMEDPQSSPWLFQY